MSEAQFLRTAALATAAALRDDSLSLQLLLGTLPHEHVTATCEGALLAMAELVRDHLPPDVVQDAIRGAQSVAHQAVQEGTRP